MGTPECCKGGAFGAAGGVFALSISGGSFSQGEVQPCVQRTRSSSVDAVSAAITFCGIFLQESCSDLRFMRVWISGFLGIFVIFRFLVSSMLR